MLPNRALTVAGRSGLPPVSVNERSAFAGVLKRMLFLRAVLSFVLIQIPWTHLSHAGEAPDLNKLRCHARYQMALYALDENVGRSELELTALLCKDILARHHPDYSTKAWELLGEAQLRLGNYAEAARAFQKSGHRMREAEMRFEAREYQNACGLFQAELAIPEAPATSMSVDHVGHTPKAARLRIWIARCRGRLGEKATAVGNGLALIRGATDSWMWWNKDDRDRLVRTIVENAQTDPEWNDIRQLAKARGAESLQEYFDASALVEQANVKGVLDYLMRNDVNLRLVELPLWWDEILQKARSLRPAMLDYIAEQMEQNEKRASSELFLEHLHPLISVLHDVRLVKPALLSYRLKARYPDAYARWLSVLRNYRSECRAAVLVLLKGNRDGREHGLRVMNELELYDRETLDAVCVVANDPWYPTETGSLVAWWTVSGQLFGLEAAKPAITLQQARDVDRRTALAQACAWWQARRADFKPGEQVPMHVSDRDILRRGLLFRVQPVREAALARLAAAGDESVLSFEWWEVLSVRSVKPVFLRHPQATIDGLIAHNVTCDLERMTGVRFADDAAWIPWWQQNRAVWDFVAPEQEDAAGQPVAK